VLCNRRTPFLLAIMAPCRSSASSADLSGRQPRASSTGWTVPRAGGEGDVDGHGGYDQPAQPDRGGAVPHAITIRLKALWGEKP
jgi:hypothetical protein